jgi:DNA mismatch repair protein MutS
LNFELDRQTLKDLDIFSEGSTNHSVFHYYNRTKTSGGKDCLLKIMQHPLTDIKHLRNRVELIRFLASTGFELKINVGQFDFIEHYLRLNIPTLRNNLVDTVFQRLSYLLKPTNEYYLIQKGILQLKFLFNHLKEKLVILNRFDLPDGLSEEIKFIHHLIDNDDFIDIHADENRISYSSLNRLDFMFRKKYRNKIKEFIRTVYRLDAYVSIGKVANENGLAFPEYQDECSNGFSLKGLYHPLLPDAVPYDFKICDPHTLCFLTGPNMAGKSTFLKSLGIALYLSHLGFPVPAAKMTTSVYHGMITTINLSDNITKGYSHFYAEVKRVKEIALNLKKKDRLFVICDELFRGTNVKDAFEASLLIIESFAGIKQSTFCISTHITEVAEKLGKLKTIDFKYFDARLIDNTPVYEYKLKDGVSFERLGMYILKNENIVGILNSIQNNL